MSRVQLFHPPRPLFLGLYNFPRKKATPMEESRNFCRIRIWERIYAEGEGSVPSRRKIKRVKTRFYAIALGTVLVITVYILLIQLTDRNNALIREKEESVLQQQQKNTEMQRKIDFAKTEEFAEREARRILDLAREGETRYVVEDGD
jgi:cell division protein FtsL